MSTRLYPLYQKGGPQLRIFLPNFWLKLIRPVHEQPPNVVQFACSMEMTKHDIQNYLEQIYNVKIAHVRTRIALGKTKRNLLKGYITKDDDVKLAYVTLPKGETFVFPECAPDQSQKAKDDHEKALNETKKGYQNFLDKNKYRPNMPGWFQV
ncbi:ribosomal protein l23-related [Holotrichia oblita]|uniref:Ribosomal protein l23-related n=1 Tax=Holotrichia oblita TaxID=644536 RepID=A0ACB9TA32_HOLOL|nr:ribosomal protein l23-related [Holotrichia oblita]